MHARHADCLGGSWVSFWWSFRNGTNAEHNLCMVEEETQSSTITSIVQQNISEYMRYSLANEWIKETYHMLLEVLIY